MEIVEIDQHIKDLEAQGLIDPECKQCQAYFYPQLREGKHITSIFAPRHKAIGSCRSGKNNHCTCDTCF